MQVLSETEEQLRVFSESILTTTVLEKSCRIPYVDPATVKETSKTKHDVGTICTWNPSGNNSGGKQIF